MKAIILNGSQANDATGQRVRTVLTAQLQNQGWDVDHIALCEQKIGSCAGDFFCWIRSPGVCNVNDDNRAIAAAAVASDLLVYLTPISFGGYAPTLKGMVDHLIQNVSPFFTEIEGETHHVKRYRKYPDLLVVGWLNAPDPQLERVFHHLVHRNALNWHAKTWVSDVVMAGQADAALQAAAQRWVDDVENGRSSSCIRLRQNSPIDSEAVDVRRALLLVGSPKTRKSTSNSLGGYMFEQLNARGIETETIYLHTVLRSPQKRQALLEAVDQADLITLAFPLYVDTLPAPVIEALECIATHRQNGSQPRRRIFTAIANCGFPEAQQCDNALALCENFARVTGFSWAGGMALGGGQMVNGARLDDGGGKTAVMRQSLDMAAAALAEGKAIPEAARDRLARPIVPHKLYWLMAAAGWLLQARQHRALRGLWRRPYLASA